MISGGADAIIIEIKRTINVTRLSHPETTLPAPHTRSSVEKLSSVKLVPGPQKNGRATLRAGTDAPENAVVAALGSEDDICKPGTASTVSRRFKILFLAPSMGGERLALPVMQ